MGWREFRATKAYDLLCATPNILWLLYGIARQWAVLIGYLREMALGTITWSGGLQFVSISASALLYGTFIYFSIVRTTPTARSSGIVPRATALAGAFIMTGLLYLPAVTLPLAVQVISVVLIFGGSLGAVWTLQSLGRSFSILPEARTLITTGPYAYVRHPLYVWEATAVLGTALQFLQPWALLLWVLSLVLQFVRSGFEERVLEAQFPEYAGYRQRTRRFVPGVF